MFQHEAWGRENHGVRRGRNNTRTWQSREERSPGPPLPKGFTDGPVKDRNADETPPHVTHRCGLRVEHLSWGRSGQPQPAPVLSEPKGKPSGNTIKHQTKLASWRVWVSWENRKALPKISISTPNPRGLVAIWDGTSLRVDFSKGQSVPSSCHPAFSAVLLSTKDRPHIGNSGVTGLILFPKKPSCPKQMQMQLWQEKMSQEGFQGAKELTALCKSLVLPLYGLDAKLYLILKN